MKLYLHHFPNLSIVRNNVADPFRPPEGKAVLREKSGFRASSCATEPKMRTCAAFRRTGTSIEAISPARRYGFSTKDGSRTSALSSGLMAMTSSTSRSDNLIVFQHAVRRSRRRPFEVRVFPPFHEDLVASVFDGGVPPPPQSGKPVIGFCGHAKPRVVDEAKRLLRKALSRCGSTLGLAHEVPEPWGSHVVLRHQVLRALARDARITPNFVIRDQYRAGVRAKAERRNLKHQTALEFFENILSSDYTVCVRGGGNFSVRLFETLCLGRLPLIVDTDLLLPWPDDGSWQDVSVRVDARNLAALGDTVISHWRSMCERREDVFLAAREFWVKRLSLRGYFSHFRELLLS